MRVRLLSLAAVACLVACFEDPPITTSDDENSDESVGTSDDGDSTDASDESDASTGDTTTDETESSDTTESTESTEDTTESDSSDSSEESSDPVCGDGVVDPGEVCDDGLNAGEQEGDCAPDCSKIVETRLIVPSPDLVHGDFAGGGNAVNAADAHCPNGYKAWLVDGQNRVASVTPLLGNGQVDWILDTWTRYANADNETIWTTTELTLLGVSDDNAWVGLENPMTSSASLFMFTGMRRDYTTSPADCDGWGSGQGGGLNVFGAFGDADAVDDSAIGSPNDNGGLCTVERGLYCVEQ